MRKGRKILLGLVVFVAVALVGVAIVVPWLIDVDHYRSQVVAHLQEETGKPASIGHLGLTLFPALSVRLDDFVLGNPPGFPAGEFLKVRRITVVLDASALWNRQILVKSLELDHPRVSLLSDMKGRWNFENPPRARVMKAAARREEKPLFTLGVISNLSLQAGELAGANLLPSGRPGPSFFSARRFSCHLEQVDLNAFAGSASASLIPGAGASYLMSRASWWTSAAYAESPASRPAAQGSMKADLLRFGTIEATEVKSRVRLLAKRVYFDDLNFDFYDGRTNGKLEFNFAGQTPRYNVEARLSGVDVGRLLAAFPETRGKMTGKMDGNVKLSGEVEHSPDPLAGMKGSGRVSVRNGELPSLQLNKNLMLLARLNNLGPASGDPSSFSSMSTEFSILNDRLTTNKVTIVGNGVDIDGSGNLALAGAGSMDYQGVARLAAGQSAVSNLLQGLAGATAEGGKLSFPFSIAGTLGNPKFLLKSAGGNSGRLGGLQGLAAGKRGAGAQPGQAQQPRDLVRGLAGLLKKKQPQPAPQPPNP